MEMVEEDRLNVEEDMEEAEEDSMEEDTAGTPTQEGEIMDSKGSEESVSTAVLVDTRKPTVERRKLKKKEPIQPSTTIFPFSRVGYCRYDH